MSDAKSNASIAFATPETPAYDGPGEIVDGRTPREEGDLLCEVFKRDIFGVPYLNWQYFDNPNGEVVRSNHLRDGKLMAHYAVIPQVWNKVGSDAAWPIMLSLNSAVHPEAQRQGWFTRLGERCYAISHRDYSAHGVIAVGNANSTHGLIKSLHYQRMETLPVRIAPTVPVRPKTVKTYKVDASFLAGGVFTALVESLDDAPVRGVSQRWTRDILAWRLSCPARAYRLHVSDQAMIVSTRETEHGVPFALVLKAIARKGAPETVDHRPLWRAAAAVHSTPLVAHIGWNARLVPGGFEPPSFLKRSPLNLTYRAFDERLPQNDTLIETMESFDFDPF